MAGRASSSAPKVAVLMGGPSAEREVSLSSGHECAVALRQAGYEVTEIDAGRDLPAQLAAAAPDMVFNALHGRWGEDGCVQGLMDWLGFRYTHSGVLASALAMDKTRAKHAFREAGLPVMESLIADAAEVRQRHVMPPPYVVKPNDEGSSVGVYIVHDGANAPPQLSDKMPARVMVETYAPGRELTTAVLGDRALGVTEIVTSGWYDYDAKYKPGGSRHVIPAEIPAEIDAACRDYAVRAHAALGCSGLSRTDFRWDDSRGLDGLILLEVNTQPGMTPTSLAPEQAAHVGMDFPALCDWIVKEALCRA
ncbi:D-alanine--D-alanine ligase [Paracoccus shanxieyensis]|uniref:D-alanine--D-alanine ligase n=1 Tax=Paracoccus shanxieyensis TaxID=2675752 RepID=A0A6L6J1P5_9RHOB|nr:D-alanine--D-alanine ligase [Paracoccus shanxieyensis]MTH65738.1 D-alanine--D-alanine ligase [Paracoccus shanxieyensis]MTH88887.1 D-alanine--D-alanine ligase [Paracoccus shanxieyensis]